MKTIQDIASQLIALCEKQEFVQAYKELFAADAVSIDPIYKNEPMKGLEQLIEREKAFLASVELHDVKISAPIFAGSYFSVAFSMSFTPAGQDLKSVNEVAVYKVTEGQIVSQQFFVG